MSELERSYPWIFLIKYVAPWDAHMEPKVSFTRYFTLIWKLVLGSGKYSEIRPCLPLSSLLSSWKGEIVMTSHWKLSCYSLKLLAFILSSSWERSPLFSILKFWRIWQLLVRTYQASLFDTIQIPSLNFQHFFQFSISLLTTHWVMCLSHLSWIVIK